MAKQYMTKTQTKKLLEGARSKLNKVAFQGAWHLGPAAPAQGRVIAIMAKIDKELNRLK